MVITGFEKIEFEFSDTNGPFFVQRYFLPDGDYYQVTFASDGIRTQHKTETIHKANWDI